MKWLVLLISILMIGCQFCQQYDAVVIQYGEMVVKYNKEYIQKDTGLTAEEKEVMIKACDEYLKLLKQE